MDSATPRSGLPIPVSLSLRAFHDARVFESFLDHTFILPLNLEARSGLEVVI